MPLLTKDIGTPSAFAPKLKCTLFLKLTHNRESQKVLKALRRLSTFARLFASGSGAVHFFSKTSGLTGLGGISPLRPAMRFSAAMVAILARVA